MQQDKHPDCRPVVFRDRAAGYAFLTRSTATSDQVIEWDDGRTYPVVDVETSSESHPFYTGKARTVDSEALIARFERRYGGGAAGAATRPVPPGTPADRRLGHRLGSPPRTFSAVRESFRSPSRWSTPSIRRRGRVLPRPAG
ncbi:type B 50S ribosomal protein L31 [Streptomyces marianii]|uniref:Large ribosomal subunit protein bL31B n=1 Tax=Streptomyces marianii TaxID=1817406 RepID=A0A5R9EI98_9ACTN|nr:type B 50S ribosomal protein L31 [Streptomyces marianii]